jgi:hypothetical protein
VSGPADDVSGGERRAPSDVDGLLEVAGRLWPAPATVQLVRDARQPARVARDWLILPSLGKPWLLLPAWSATAADALLRDDHGQRSPQIVHALAVLHRQRMLARIPLPRLRVSSPGTVDTIETELTRILHKSSDVVVRLGRRRWNRSVVLRPLDAAGRTLAYVKSAASQSGVDALRREREHLRRVATLGPRLVEWPEVLHHGSWRDLDLLALSPLIGDGSTKNRSRAPSAAMRALALSAERGRQPVAETDLSNKLAGDIQRLSHSEQRSRLRSAVDLTMSRLGQVKVPIGCWHGDWVPWNMTSHGDRVLLWDWEHFAEGVPIGLDGVHYRAQQLRMFKGTDRRVEDRWVREATEWLLNTFQLSTPQIRATILAYLLEVNVRYLRDREEDPRGIPPREGWGLPLIDRLTAELD